MQQHKTNPGPKIEKYIFLKPAASTATETWDMNCIVSPSFEGKILYVKKIPWNDLEPSPIDK